MTVQVYLKGEMIERGTGKPGFRWVQGYYGINPDNGHKFYPPVTRREAFAMAKRDGEKALFFDTEQQIDEWVNKTSPKGTLTMIMTPELMENIQAETGESSSDAMDLIGHLTSAESCETMEDLEANLLMAKQAAETILSNVKDQIARLKGGK